MEHDIELLQSLVETDSGTADVAGVNQVQDIVERELKQLGFVTERFKNPLGASRSGSLLCGLFRPKNAATDRVITLVTHADTVFERIPGGAKLSFSDDGKRAYGPGVIDDKGSAVIALAALRKLFGSGFELKIPLYFVSSPNEEIGSPGFSQKFQEISAKTLMVLGCEPAMEDGGIIEGRRGNRWYHVTVKGREAHAGRAHHEGVNAAHELVIKLDRLQRLTDYDQGVTVNIGSIRAGEDKYNIVCAHAEAKVDARFPDFQSRARLHEKVENILSEKIVCSQDRRHWATTTYEVVDDCPPFARTPGSAPFLSKYLDILSGIERKQVSCGRSGGCSDANYLSREELIILDGLGAMGGGIHTPHEFIELSSIESRSDALCEFLKWSSAELARPLTSKKN